MTCDRTNTAQKKASVRLANEFLDSAIVCLVSDPTREETRSSLAELVLQAIKLSYLLWTQMIHLAPKFINNPMIGTTFEHNNPLVEPHRLLNKYPDDLEGSPILLLTHPALMQHGNDDGTDFTVRSLLKKAIYWTAMPRPTA